MALSVVGATTAAQRGVDRPGDLVAAGEYRFRFTNIGALHERADGALLVTDRSEKQLYLLADLTREPRTLGRKGDGPQEFRSPHALLETGGDTVILTDAQLPRWYLVNGGHVSDAPAWSQRLVRLTRSPLTVDSAQRVYWISVLTPKGARSGQLSRASADSAVLLRTPIRGGTVDTLARLRSKFGAMRMVRKRVMGVESYYALNDPMRVPDQVAICADGWMAIAFAQARRVEWRRPDGRVAAAISLRTPPLRVTEAIKRDAMVRFLGKDVATWFSPTDFPAFPQRTPSVQSNGVHCTYDGRLLIERYDLLSNPVVYDVVARNGAIGAPVQLPPRSKVVGQSGRFIYAAVPDEDDLLILRRYRWR